MQQKLKGGARAGGRKGTSYSNRYRSAQETARRFAIAVHHSAHAVRQKPDQTGIFQPLAKRASISNPAIALCRNGSKFGRQGRRKLLDGYDVFTGKHVGCEFVHLVPPQRLGDARPNSFFLVGGGEEVCLKRDAIRLGIQNTEKAKFPGVVKDYRSRCIELSGGIWN
ncbi:hypothetical protein BN6_79930 [Saccharothrix espanaensis DSM 44229]|uniref:Uncharacterized protein n=1 Tax=Saccharothrix espanaensis (strain ATCC 51144 / DSM 44229 / JCM 9112 / NBRC 15066 / NRRL 15764) TaxID=1179773 RepID=K0KA67_SACES|nr:hypothetical protein BN6_79930 [Saccharothrix espanaensis DSM 44229]